MNNNQIKHISDWLGSGSINFFGHPFAGKDTQGEILANLFNGEIVAGGDILRHYHDQDKIKELMSTGDLFPTDFYLQIVLPFLSQERLRGKPLMLSSVGRLQGEEQIIMQATAESGHPIKAVVLLHLTEEEVWRRFEEAQVQNDRGERADDNREVLKTRLIKFQEKTMPVVDYYRELGLLIEVDGTLSREDVTKEIIISLEKYALKFQEAASPASH
jgi:adenylate kinase